MRLVADTNIVVSAFLWHGSPHRLLDAVEEGAISLYTSGALLDELADVLGRRKLAKALHAANETPATLLARYREIANRVSARPIPSTTLRDPDDEQVLACAAAARADLIVTGDRALLEFKAYRATRIVTVAKALELIYQE